MRKTRVNIGITADINDIINEGAFQKGESRSGIFRLAIKERYPFEKLEPVEGPFTIYVRVNIPREGAAYIRKLAYKNKLSLASIYCAVVKKYLHGSIYQPTVQSSIS